MGFALEHFLSQDPKDINLIDLLYSGTPNVSRIRDYEVDDRRNVLTPDRLRFFENYMDKQGLSKITSPEQRVFIVDQMGSGASMNVFLRILRHYFTSKGMNDLPQITVLLMNFQSKEIHKQGTGYYLFNAERETLSFASAANTKDRSRSLMVHALPLDIPNIVVDACEDEVLQSLVKHQFPAYCWSEKYQHLINKKPENAQGLKEYFWEYYRMISSVAS